MATLIDKRKIDVSGTFLVYMATVGSVERTALACELPEDTVRQLAASEGWNDKIRSVTMAAKTGGMRSEEFFILQNRCVAFVQASRMRSVLDKVLCSLQEKTQEELMADITEEDKLGNTRVNARLFSDLAKALETANGLAFASLGDTIPERKASAPDAAASTAAVHQALIAALNGPGIRAKASDAIVAEVSQALDIEAKLVPTEASQVIDRVSQIGAVERKALAAPPSDVAPSESPPTQ